MLKAKKYDWKDSNMALFGSDTEKKVKKESAETEKAWAGSGQKVGTQIWRIEKFKVVHWPKDDYGKFYDGDSYIILNTYKEEEEIKYDVHFWIGKHSSQDEYGTAAYKTVELDTFHDDKPVQHREVQGHESSLFKSYFDTMTIMRGGCDSGFRRVEPKMYKPRLLHFCRTGRKVLMQERPLNVESLNSGDVFILDNGLTIYQWNGKACNKDEKFSASIECQKIESDRGGKVKTFVVEEGDPEAREMLKILEAQAQPLDDDDDKSEAADKERELYKLSDAGGSLEFDLVVKGIVSKDNLQSDDVFILDGKQFLFVWVGAGASVDERRNAMTHAHNYLMKTDHPLIPVSVFGEGKETKQFHEVF